MEILQTETTQTTTARSDEAPLDQQVRLLVACLDEVSERLLMKKPTASPELSQQEFKALMALGARNLTTMSDLASAVNVPLSTATHTVDRMVKKGLVERKRPTEDRRIVQVGLSKRGVQVYEAYFEDRLIMARGMLGALSPAEREIYLELTEQMRRYVPRSEADESAPEETVDSQL